MSQTPKIDDHFAARVALAEEYAKDGAFCSSARVLRELADTLITQAELAEIALYGERS